MAKAKKDQDSTPSEQANKSEQPNHFKQEPRTNGSLDDLMNVLGLPNHGPTLPPGKKKALNYAEALKKVEANKYLIGLPLFQYKVEHLVISTLDDLGDVVVSYFNNGFNNQLALEEAGILRNENLKIFLFPARYIASQLVSELDSYLAKSAPKK